MANVLGNYILAARTARGLKRSGLARMMGFKNINNASAKITLVERGLMPDDQFLEKLTVALGLDRAEVSRLVDQIKSIPVPIDHATAWLRLVAAEGRAASLAAIARILEGPWDGRCDHFVVVPASSLTPGPESRLLRSAEVLSLPRKPGRFHDNIDELLQGFGPGDCWTCCIVLKDWVAEDIVPLMAGLGLEMALIADEAGLALLHQNGRREALEGSVDEEGVLSAWCEWSRRRYPDGPTLHRLSYPVSGWTSALAQGIHQRERLEARYGRAAVEEAVQRIIAGVDPAVAVAEMMPV